jgi:hypothetical protein
MLKLWGFGLTKNVVLIFCVLFVTMSSTAPLGVSMTLSNCATLGTFRVATMGGSEEPLLEVRTKLISCESAQRFQQSFLHQVLRIDR